MNKIFPSAAVVADLARMTDENQHGKCYAAVAEWCFNNSTGDDRAVFELLKESFDKINAYQDSVDSMDGDVYMARYCMGKVMDNLIVRVFGDDVLKEINKGR